MKRLNQTGSHVIAVVVGVLVVGVIAFVGYTVSQRNKQAANTSTTAQAASQAPTAIKTQADLTQASKALDDSSTQVDSNLDDTSLNSDLNDLL